MKILIVEDHPDNRYFLETLLKANGFDVTTASNGKEALAKLDQSDISIVISDILMPEMDGYQLCRAIRSHPGQKNHLFIFYTATYVEERDEALAYQLGADLFLRKPMEPEKLLETIDNAIAEWQKEACTSRKRIETDTSLQLLYQERLNAKLEKKTRELEQELAERTRLSTAIDQAGEAVCITDTDMRVQYVNPAFEKILGYTRMEIMDQPLWKLNSDRHPPGIDKIVQDMLNQGDTWQGRIILLRKDNQPVDMDMTLSPVIDRGGQIINCVAVGRDITREMALESQLRQAQKIEAIGTLASGIAHDFNNILSAILGYSEIMLMSMPQDNPFRSDVTAIYQAGNRARELVAQILAFSRQTEQERRPLHVSTVIKEALKMLRASLPSTIRIETRIETRGKVLADPTHIHQILMNLCSNAAHAMRENGGVLNVELLNADISDVMDHPELGSRKCLKLIIRDTGCGIAPEVADRMFDPFFTTKEKGEGTGLGLSVVHGIVSDYQGEITARSFPGKGSTFTVFLPILEEADVESDIMNLIPKGGRESILFVDDEKPLVTVGQKMLSFLGYHVTATCSSLEALHLFESQPNRFDAVITDQTMPQLSGTQLAERIRNIRKDIPIIVCTGFSHAITPSRIKDLGITALLMKPLVASDLANTLRQVLDQRQECTP